MQLSPSSSESICKCDDDGGRVLGLWGFGQHATNAEIMLVTDYEMDTGRQRQKADEGTVRGASKGEIYLILRKKKD